jgi:hypothetical protein
MFSKMIRRTVDAALPGAVGDLSEMLPLFDQTWLTDVSGRRYTSEFRFVVLDSRKPAPSSLYEAKFNSSVLFHSRPEKPPEQSLRKQCAQARRKHCTSSKQAAQ